MKIYRSSRYNDEQMLELEVDIRYFRDYVESASILDINDPAFRDFEADVLDACELHDFEPQDSYSSNDANSISQYYIYTKTNEDHTKLKVFLKIRISDHVPPIRQIGGRPVTYDDRDGAYTKDQAKQHAQENYSQPRGYKVRRMNIVFNDDFYTSYESALRAIEDRLDEFDPEE